MYLFMGNTVSTILSLAHDPLFMEDTVSTILSLAHDPLFMGDTMKQHKPNRIMQIH